MKHDQKRAFTVVELVVVIAVIAILAAVLVPTFSNLMEKAKQSADEQTVASMNLALEAEELSGTKPEDMDKVKEILLAAGFRVPTEATANGYEYYWIANDNRVALVKMNGETPTEIVYPTELATKYKSVLPSEWYSLKGEPCKHEGEKTYTALESNGKSYYHKVVCNDCEQLIAVELHDKLGEAGACSLCKHMNTVVIPAECNHKDDDGNWQLEFAALALETGGSEYHNVVCKICGKLITKEAKHQFGPDGKCTDCGFKRVTGDEECSHAIKTYTSNIDGTHTVTCGICGESWKENCQYVLIKDQSAGTEKIQCAYCDYEYHPKTEHVHTYEYTDNGDGTHSRKCTDPACDDAEAANVDNIQCSYGEVKEENGQKYRECIYCGHRKEQSDLKNGLVDGFYYKNDQLFTGEEGSYEYEYGKLVLRVDSTEPGDGIKYEWNFKFESASGQPIDPQYVTDNIVLKFPDNEDKFQPGDSTINHVILTGFEDYTAKSVSLTPNINMNAAIDMLQEAVDSGNTTGIMDLIEKVFHIDSGYYPVGTESDIFTEWKRNISTYSTYTGYLKNYFDIDHLYELLTEENWKYVATAAYGGFELIPNFDGLNAGNAIGKDSATGTFVSELPDDDWVFDGSLYYRYRDPEYVLQFWKFNYEHAYFGVISYDKENAKKSISGSSLGKDSSINWKRTLSSLFSSNYLSSFELYAGVDLGDNKNFFVTSAAHWYLMLNSNQSASMPTQTFNIMLEKK